MKRLYWKIFGFLLLAQLVTIFTISSGFWLHQHNRMANSEGVEISPPARTVIQSASATLQHGGKQALIALLEEWQLKRMPQVLAIDADGNELLNRSYSDQALATATSLIASDATQSVNAITLSSGENITLFVPDTGRHLHKHHHGKKLRHLRVGGPPAPSFLERGQFRGLPLWPIIASIIVSLIFAAIIAWYFSKPIQLLHSAFSKGAKGHLDSQIAKQMGKRKDAFADLGKDFDAMATRLSKLIKGQKRLLNHVSHELRSPLSRMQIAIGLAKQNAEKIPSALDRIQLESERMDQLIGELLQLSKLESGVSALQKQPVNLSHLLQDMLNDASFEAAEKNIHVESHISENCTLNCDAELIYRAIENIVRNALKYTHPDTTVSVALAKTKRHLIVEVTDQGDGVDEQALEDIFQPFVRTNHAQPKHGYGIGLALAKQVIEAHDGSVHAANNTAKKGLTVSIKLPIA